MDKTNKIIVVTGATGNQGGAVARCLLNDGWTVRALTRSPEKPAARELAHAGATVIQCDLNNRGSLRNALRGDYGCFSVQGVVENEIELGMNVADACLEAGIKHCVYSSVAAADRKTGISFFDSKYEIEQYCRSLHLPLTILRPVFFMDNLNGPDIRNSILQQGTLSLPIRPDVPLQMIAVRDIGLFAATVFDNPDEYLGADIELAGDEITMVQVAEALTRDLNRKVRYQQTPIEVISKANKEMGKMFQYFDDKGFQANIGKLRQICPDLMTLETWLTQSHYAETLVGTRTSSSGT